jgi:hypothetical protein
MTESQYQAQLIVKLLKIFPGCIILKNDASYQQGVPDLIVLWNDRWASLEVKASKLAQSVSRQPNQSYFIERLDEMSFAAYIYPENEEEVLHALQQAFKPSRRTRVSKS